MSYFSQTSTEIRRHNALPIIVVIVIQNIQFYILVCIEFFEHIICTHARVENALEN